MSGDAGVGQQAGEEGEDTPTRAGVHHEEAGRSVRGPGRGKGNAAAPVGAGDNPDKALDGQTPVDCGVADELDDGGKAVVAGNGVLDGHRGVKVGGVAVVVGVEVEAEVDDGDDDDATTVVVEPAAGLAVVVVVAVVGAADGAVVGVVELVVVAVYVL